MSSQFINNQSSVSIDHTQKGEHGINKHHIVSLNRKVNVYVIKNQNNTFDKTNIKRRNAQKSHHKIRPKGNPNIIKQYEPT